MNKKILLFGGSGMLGGELLRCFGTASGYEVISVSHDKVDISDRDAVFSAIRDLEPHIIINAAVLVNVDTCEMRPDRAYAVDTLGPLFIADSLRTLRRSETVFVHFSSSDVFGSEFGASPSEDEKKFFPINVYSRSKYYAETCIRGLLEKEGFPLYIVRSSWIFSEFRKTFVDAVVEYCMHPNGAFVVAEDQRGVPTWGRDIAEGTRRLIEEHYPYGIYHFVAEVSGNEATRFDIAREISAVLGRGDAMQLFTRVPRKEVFKTPRPASSVIVNTKFPKFPRWQESLKTFLHENSHHLF